MDNVLNFQLLTPANILRILIMLAAGAVIIYLISRALPDLVPTKPS